MPTEIMAFAQGAVAAGFKVIIAGAGGAAHLPGMVASLTTLPVIGVPVPLTHLDGMDSLLSIVQMPAGVPVATVGIGNAKNAALLAARILGVSDSMISAKVEQGLKTINEEAKKKGSQLNAKKKTGF
jgi:5-(carboxyamino)imidazole ribonucleotide mutase